MTAACVPQNLSFRVDKRVAITSPKDRSDVSLPITLRWNVHDFNVKTSYSQGGSFAVFVDESPVPPGKPLSWVARNDADCPDPAACITADYLAKKGIYQTTDTSVVISEIPGVVEISKDDEKKQHRAVIVLLDNAGKRIGEIAYDVTFKLKRKS